MRRWLLAASLLVTAAAAAETPAWNPQPWLADLAQMRAALEEKYANLDWLTGERGMSLDQLFGRAEAAIRDGGDDAAARRALDRLVERIGDGHVDLTWPEPKTAPVTAAAASAPTPASFCAALGYRDGFVRPGTAGALPGFRALAGQGPFPTGLVDAGGARVGVVRIGVFMPQAFPELCLAAVAAERIPIDRACDEVCADRIITHAFAAMTSGFAGALERVRAAGATTLLVDLGGNGGGTEWAEAAARMLSRRPLQSLRMGFVRGPHWAKQWADLADRLRPYLNTAAATDRPRLRGWIAQAEAAKALAATPVAAGEQRIGRAGHATGLVAGAPAGSFAGREWAVHVFSPAQYGYRDGVWDGPVVVLVDGETWSAAEEFAAVLRDNDAAIVMGERTGGAGCGHTWGGTPTTLTNSRAVLQVPDCIRFRRDGSNEVNGVIPDVLTGVRTRDGAAFAAKLTAAKLPKAVTRAGALYAARP